MIMMIMFVLGGGLLFDWFCDFTVLTSFFQSFSFYVKAHGALHT